MSWVTDHAEIEYTQEGEDDLRVLLDKKDRSLTFSSELKAHEYLNKLSEELVDE